MAAEAIHRLGPYTVTVPTGFGPRLLGLSRDEGPEILVRLGPDVAIDAGEAGTYRTRGGHRLWVAPEYPPVSYAPDDHSCDVRFNDGRLWISSPVDSAGFVKQLEVRTDEDRLVIDHALRWTGTWPITVAAWAITQLPLGGTAILPLAAASESQYQADRALVLWPYTDLADERLEIRPGVLLLHARPGPRLKVGAGPDPGRIGYLRDGWLFTKTVEPAGDGAFPDRGAVGQVFANDIFCEVESLGPLVQLSPDTEIHHQEMWQVEQCPDLDAALDRVTGK